mmetsp:Transcript_124076/g.310134  ORF Transcript_124076/g.310134 Transcript_124076/m.310134 type:complete len:249 (+) Transcript_124076:668-1414(+)
MLLDKFASPLLQSIPLGARVVVPRVRYEGITCARGCFFCFCGKSKVWRIVLNVRKRKRGQHHAAETRASLSHDVMYRTISDQTCHAGCSARLTPPFEGIDEKLLAPTPQLGATSPNNDHREAGIPANDARETMAFSRHQGCGDEPDPNMRPCPQANNDPHVPLHSGSCCVTHHCKKTALKSNIGYCVCSRTILKQCPCSRIYPPQIGMRQLIGVSTCCHNVHEDCKSSKTRVVRQWPQGYDSEAAIIQ